MIKISELKEGDIIMVDNEGAMMEAGLLKMDCQKKCLWTGNNN